MLLPRPRGPVTTRLVAALRRDDPALLPAALAPATDPIVDDDVQLALWICYELHYRGFDDVGDEWEWQPELVRLRRDLERPLLAWLRKTVDVPANAAPVADRLRELVESDDGPELARFLQRTADRRQFSEFVAHRSVYHLKEADPHSWAIPRLSGRAKAALVEIQADEYGGGDLARMHASLFAGTMRGLGLDDRYGRYVDAVPGVTLAVSNVMSMFGLRRELRGAVAGHLAAFEMTSSAPNRRYSQGLHRLGGDADARRFYDVHVTADALHEQIAVHDLCGALVADEPHLAQDVLFGGACALYVDNRFAEHLLSCWRAGRSSLYDPSGFDPPVTAEVS